MNEVSRREFLRELALGTAIAGTAGLLSSCGAAGDVRGGGLPQITPGPATSRIVTAAGLATQEAYDMSGDRYTILASAENTGGDFSVFEFLFPPGGGPRPHIHTHEAESFYGINGTVFGSADHVLTPFTVGCCLYGAQGRVHAVNNQSGEFARVLSLASPSGLEGLFRGAGIRVFDRSSPIAIQTPTQLQHVVEVSLHRGDQPFLPEAVAPTDPKLLNRVLTTGPGINIDPALAGIDGLVAFTRTGRSPFAGPFGVGGINLIGFSETNGTLNYNEFTQTTQAALPATIVSADHQVLYVLEGTLTVTVGAQVGVAAAPSSFIYVSPGTPFAFANLGAATVKALYIVPRRGSNTL